jgi:hypothetical protein
MAQFTRISIIRDITLITNLLIIHLQGRRLCTPKAELYDDGVQRDRKGFTQKTLGGG